ncbi:hypothetical protein Tco_0568385 [Tanacetum coccineum]
MAEAGFGAYWAGSDRLIPDKGDLRDYRIEISSDRDLLGPGPLYVLIRDPIRRLCHKMIAYNISGRRQAPEKVTDVDLFYLRSIDRGTTNVSHLLAQYLFRYAKGRKSRTSLGGSTSAQGLTTEEGALEIPALAQAPLRPPPTPQPWTMSQRIERIEEEVHDLQRDVVGLRGVVESFTIEQSRVFTWLISCMTQLMDTSGYTYQPFDSTLVGSSRFSF